VLAIPVSLTAQQVVFSTDVAANRFGPVIPITDTDFTSLAPPLLAYDGLRNEAILGHDTPSEFILPPMIAVVNLTTGSFTKFVGLGLGEINGIAVDSEDRIVATDTSFDANVQFYNLAKKTHLTVPLPGGGDASPFTGTSITYDSVNKFFLVAQKFSATGSGSSIVVYDTEGNFEESLDGFDFTGTGNVFPVHIAINPNTRSGFVDGPDEQDHNIQSFTY
jgi:hypothetical protein